MKILLVALFLVSQAMAGLPPVSTTGENYIQKAAGNKVHASAVNLAGSNVTGVLPFANYASPQSTIVFNVDKSRTDTYTADGTAIRPYKTISAALSAIPATAVAADSKVPYTIVIAPGAYDESLTIPSGRIITLLGQGTVVLGDGAGTNWNSTTPRNIAWNPVAADLHGSDIKPALTIATMAPSDATSTFIAEANNFTISGNLTMNGDGTTKTLNLHGVKLWGALTHTDASLVNWQSYRTIVIGAVTTTGNLVLERAYDSRFNALLSVNAVNMAFNSNFAGGITVSSIQQNLLPNGFFHCNIAGTFTGVDSSARFDAATDYYFVTNGASLAGGATKVLIANIASSTLTGLLSSTDWGTFNTAATATTAATALNTVSTIVNRDGSGNFSAGQVTETSALIGGASSASNAVLVAKDGHIKSTQTTAPTAVPTSNAGTGATCSIANATDVAGTINLTTTGVLSSSGDECDITFNKTYNVAPICVVTPTNANAILDAVIQGVYFSTSTSALSVNFSNTDAVGRSYQWAYNCIETQ